MKSLVKFIVVIMLIFSSISTIQNISSSNQSSEKTLSNQLVIEGNNDFLTMAKAENWSGNGTQNSPFILSISNNIQIIKIENTDLYFEIKNTNILSDTGFLITFFNVSNGIMAHNSFSINSIYQNASSGIWFSACENFRVFDNIFNFTVNNEINTNSLLHIMDANITFENNIFSSIYVEFYYAEDIIFINNTVMNVMQSGYPQDFFGLTVWQADHITISNNIICNNVAGIKIRLASNILITKNRIFNNKYLGISMESNSNNNSIKFNEIYQNSGDGFDLEGYSNIIAYNSLFKNHGYGILSSSGMNNQIINNAMFDNGKDGIFVFNSSDVLYGNNIIANNSIYNNNLYKNNNQNSLYLILISFVFVPIIAIILIMLGIKLKIKRIK